MVFDLIHLMYYCEWCFFMQVLVGSPASIDFFSTVCPAKLIKKQVFSKSFYDYSRETIFHDFRKVTY